MWHSHHPSTPRPELLAPLTKLAHTRCLTGPGIFLFLFFQLFFWVSLAFTPFSAGPYQDFKQLPADSACQLSSLRYPTATVGQGPTTVPLEWQPNNNTKAKRLKVQFSRPALPQVHVLQRNYAQTLSHILRHHVLTHLKLKANRRTCLFLVSVINEPV